MFRHFPPGTSREVEHDLIMSQNNAGIVLI